MGKGQLLHVPVFGSVAPHALRVTPLSG
jgi:hypothetical protein